MFRTKCLMLYYILSECIEIEISLTAFSPHEYTFDTKYYYEYEENSNNHNNSNNQEHQRIETLVIYNKMHCYCYCCYASWDVIILNCDIVRNPKYVSFSNRKHNSNTKSDKYSKIHVFVVFIPINERVNALIHNSKPPNQLSDHVQSKLHDSIAFLYVVDWTKSIFCDLNRGLNIIQIKFFSSLTIIMRKQ